MKKKPRTLAEMLIQVLTGTEPVDQAYQPHSRVGKGEKVLGVIPEMLQRLLVYRTKLSALLEAQASLLKQQPMILTKPGRKNKRLLLEHHSQNDRLRLVDEFFWASLRDHIKKPTIANIGIRRHWRVVSIPPKKAPTKSQLPHDFEIQIITIPISPGRSRRQPSKG